MSAVVGMSSLIFIVLSFYYQYQWLRCAGTLVVPNYGAVGDLGSSPTNSVRLNVAF